MPLPSAVMRGDETYVKSKGVWHYLYRAVARGRQTVDFRLSTRRDVAAAKAFFRKAITSQQRQLQTITLDGYASSHCAVRELKADGSLPKETKLRSSKYLKNLIEQDQRGGSSSVSLRCWGSSSFAMQRSRSPALNH